MKLIKISTGLELSVHEFPTGSYREQNEFLRELIGNCCNNYEHVMPNRLYRDLQIKASPTMIPGQCVSMLVDEDGRLKENEPNLVGSYLYESDKHGCPIMGNILFVGEEWGEDGIDFCGIEDETLKLLEQKLNNVILKIKEGAI